MFVELTTIEQAWRSWFALHLSLWQSAFSPKRNTQALAIAGVSAVAFTLQYLRLFSRYAVFFTPKISHG